MPGFFTFCKRTTDPEEKKSNSSISQRLIIEGLHFLKFDQLDDQLTITILTRRQDETPHLKPSISGVFGFNLQQLLLF